MKKVIVLLLMVFSLAACGSPKSDSPASTTGTGSIPGTGTGASTGTGISIACPAGQTGTYPNCVSVSTGISTGTGAASDTSSNAACSPYDRNMFGSWTDADGDCQDTRAEVLIAENAGTLTFTSSSQCTVATGLWNDPYSGNTYTNASDLDIDHLVPLKDAYVSGAWKWDSTKKKQYANYLANPDYLIAVSLSLNRSKGDKDPSGWLPPNASYKIVYAKSWAAVKNEWGLTADSAEMAALKSILSGEPNIIYPQAAADAVCTGAVVNTGTGSSSAVNTGTGTGSAVNTGTGTGSGAAACCSICKSGISKACGDSCISINYSCSKPAGCACNG